MFSTSVALDKLIECLQVYLPHDECTMTIYLKQVVFNFQSVLNSFIVIFLKLCVIIRTIRLDNYRCISDGYVSSPGFIMIAIDGRMRSRGKYVMEMKRVVERMKKGKKTEALCVDKEGQSKIINMVCVTDG